MPGVVEKLLVSEGQRVAAGDVLCTVSAMKMEVQNPHPHPHHRCNMALTIGSAGEGHRAVRHSGGERVGARGHTCGGGGATAHPQARRLIWP